MDAFIPHMRIYFILKLLTDICVALVALIYLSKLIYHYTRLFTSRIRSYMRVRSTVALRNFILWKLKAPTFLKTVRLSGIELTPEERFISLFLIHPDAFIVEWSDMVGRGVIVGDIITTVVSPVKKNQPFAGSPLHAPPRGILIYGPHGCGKSLMGRALATAVDGRFLNIQTHTFMYTRFETRALLAAMFSLARKLAPCIIYIENIDHFLLRNGRRNIEALRNHREFFMQSWEVATADHWILIAGTAISPLLLENDVLSLMDVKYRCGLPETMHREALLTKFLENVEKDDDVNLHEFSIETNDLTIRQLEEICRIAAHKTIDVVNNQRRCLKQDDLISAKNRLYQQ